MCKLFFLIIILFSFCFFGYSQVSVLNRTTDYEKLDDSGFTKISSARGRLNFQLTSDVILSYQAQLGNPDSLYQIAVVYETRRIRPIVFKLKFSSVNNSLLQFYGELKRVFKTENIGNKNYSSTIRLGDNIVSITPAKILGREWVLFGFIADKNHPNGRISVAMTEDELDKLFLFNAGKKKLF